MTISKVGARDLAARMQSNAARARLAAVRASPAGGTGGVPCCVFTTP